MDNYTNNMPESLDFVIKLMSPGYMIYTLTKNRNKLEDGDIFTLIVKDETFRLNMLQKKVKMGFCCIAQEIDGVLVLDLLLKFRDIKDTIYETIINGKDEMGQLAIEALCNSPKIGILFYNERSQRIRHLLVKNQLKEDFKRYKYILSEWLDWSMEDFDRAKAKYMDLNPDAFKTWKKYMTKM